MQKSGFPKMRHYVGFSQIRSHLRYIFVDFCRSLIHMHGNSSYVVLYAQCLRNNICNAWFLDIKISTCYYNCGHHS